MSKRIIEPRCRGIVCTNSHPRGCQRLVLDQIRTARAQPASWSGGRALVVGASSGYGLASRVAAAFGHGMDTLGVYLERPPTERRTASAGWYSSAAFHAFARGHDLASGNLNGDAFSNEVLGEAIARLHDGFGPLDLLIYSVAAPSRRDPSTGVVYRSAIKAIGEPFTTKAIDTATDEVVDVTVEAATDDEIASTVAVMGGTDLRRWVEALIEEDLLAPGVRVVSYSYIGPEMTWPIYRKGTIGRAKEDLETTSDYLDSVLQQRLGGRCLVSINPSVVTQAATAIPGVNLGMSILFKVLKERGLHEEAIDKMLELLDEHIAPGKAPATDEPARIRLDEVELREDIQAECLSRWRAITTENLYRLSDYEGYRLYFDQLFGFRVDGVDYEAAAETDVPLEPPAADVTLS